MADNLEKIAPPGSLAARPDFIKTDDLTGLEGIGLNDIRLPRLAIAQGLSEQITPGAASHIKGLTLFDFFNDLSSEIYGPLGTKITFVPVHRSVKRIQFKPRSEGGGVIDMDVPADDPRTRWTTGADRKRVPPLATKYVEFVILLIRDDVPAPEPIVLSLKDTNKWNRAASTNLTSFIMLRKAPIYSGFYEVENKSEKNDNGTFGVYSIRNSEAQWVRDEKLFDFAAAFHQSLKGKTIVTEREHAEDPAATEPTASEARAAGPDM